jgi:hypothetical protein
MPPEMFHFNCSLCGAHPTPVCLDDFLRRWRECSESEFDVLLGTYGNMLELVNEATSRWHTKKSLAATSELSEWFRLSGFAVSTPVVVVQEGRLVTPFDCPVCLTPKGPREPDEYFAVWRDANRVQVANLLYELGLVIFAVVRQLPAWGTPKRLGEVGDLLALNQRALKAVGMNECPLCGRHSTCLFGDGSATNPYRCRWCLDAAGPLRMYLNLAEDLEVRAVCADAPIPDTVGAGIVPRNTRLSRRWRQRHKREGQESD